MLNAEESAAGLGQWDWGPRTLLIADCLRIEDRDRGTTREVPNQSVVSVHTTSANTNQYCPTVRTESSSYSRPASAKDKYLPRPMMM